MAHRIKRSRVRLRHTVRRCRVTALQKPRPADKRPDRKPSISPGADRLSSVKSGSRIFATALMVAGLGTDLVEEVGGRVYDQGQERHQAGSRGHTKRRSLWRAVRQKSDRRLHPLYLNACRQGRTQLDPGVHVGRTCVIRAGYQSISIVFQDAGGNWLDPFKYGSDLPPGGASASSTPLIIRGAQVLPLPWSRASTSNAGGAWRIHQANSLGHSKWVVPNESASAR